MELNLPSDILETDDVLFLLQEAFLGYKYRKHSGKLYEKDAEIPKRLISSYYNLNIDSFDKMKEAFVHHYVLNESMLEDVDIRTVHGEESMKGFKAMYDYIHSSDIEYLFDVYSLLDLHRVLHQYTPHPECAGCFRNWDVYLPGTGTEISEWCMIRPRLNELDKEVQRLRSIAPSIKEKRNPDDLLKYLDDCVILKCKLIKVHPFGDGNGRTIRGFINKLLEDAGLPPIYIQVSERTDYHEAMNLANNEGDYSEILSFYKYKICDSIIELDINDRIKKSDKGKKYSPYSLKNNHLVKVKKKDS